MRDLDKAMADIGAIRAQIARGTVFRGYGPATIALTGILALLAAGAQSVWLANPTASPHAYFGLWVATALAAVALAGAEAVTRSRRLHSDLADEMIRTAVEEFLPAAAAGVLVAFVLFRFAPENLWMLPGLWQVFAGLGILASRRSLPPGVGVVGAWYVATGLACLVLASGEHGLSPWAMGIPFGAGQLLFAFILQRTLGDGDGEA